MGRRIQTLRKSVARGLKNLQTGKSLTALAVQGGTWLGIGASLERALRLVRNMLLARLLAPQAFGSMAIVIALNGFLERFTEIGIREATVQDPRGDDPAFLNGA